MEAWEEDSDVESCRSSVISNLDELEANLYSYVHHERNYIVDENHLNECCVLPLEEGIQTFPEIFRDITKQNISIGEDEKISEEKNKNRKLEDDNSNNHNKENSGRSKDWDQEHYDSRYNVGSTNISVNEVAISKTPVTLTAEPVPSSALTLNPECNSPLVIDVLSSSDEGANIRTEHNSCSEIIRTEEIVVIDDSDSDIIIELEKVNTKRKKRKRKRDSEIPVDVKLNTVRSSIVLDDQSDAQFPELDGFQPMQSNEQADTSTPEVQAAYRASLCKSWTPQMIQFYEESWGGEYMNLSEIQRSMSDKGWDLDLTDEFCALPARAQDRRYFASRSRGWCSNCSSKGHFRNECPEDTQKISCYRCGSPNHTESHCRINICLTCGEKTNHLVTACKPCCIEKNMGSKCSVCSQQGHPPTCCPDLWRRFHSTTVPGKITRPKKGLYKEKKNIYCCNCATKGHHVYQCKKRMFNDYVPTTSRVISYKKRSVCRETDANDTHLSVNWEKVGRIAPENRVEKTSNTQGNKKRGTKRAAAPEQHLSAKIIKLSKTNSKVSKDEATNHTQEIPAKTDLPKAKKRKKQKKKKLAKLKPLKNEPKVSVRDVNTLISDEYAVENHVQSSNPSTSRGSKQKKTSNNNEHLPKTRKLSDRKMTLTKKQYDRLTTKQGEEVLKHITGQVEGSAAQMIHEENVLMFIGTKKSTLRAKRLLLGIICNDENWNKFARDTAVKNELDNTVDHAKKVASTSRDQEDIRIEIKTSPSQNERNVKCIYTALTSNSIREPNENKYKPNIANYKVKNKKSKGYMYQDVKKAKASIQGTARGFLSQKQISPDQLKVFANWALSMYGTVISGLIKYNLKVLSTVKHGKPLDFFKKHLLTIANWHNNPVMWKS